MSLISGSIHRKFGGINIGAYYRRTLHICVVNVVHVGYADYSDSAFGSLSRNISFTFCAAELVVTKKYSIKETSSSCSHGGCARERMDWLDKSTISRFTRYHK